MLKPTPIASHHIYSGRIIRGHDRAAALCERTGDRPRFGASSRRRGGRRRWTAPSRVCLVRQYRLGIEDFLWEIPAGKLDAGEAPQVCAVRELGEETGVAAERWTSSGHSTSRLPGFSPELIHLFLARDLDVGAPAPDIDEDLERSWMPLADADGPRGARRLERRQDRAGAAARATPSTIVTRSRIPRVWIDISRYRLKRAYERR